MCWYKKGTHMIIKQLHEMLEQLADRNHANTVSEAIDDIEHVRRQLDAKEAALVAVVDVMRRSDTEYCGAHESEPVTDDEWDAALEKAEDALDATMAKRIIERLSTTVGASPALSGVRDYDFMKQQSGSSDDE